MGVKPLLLASLAAGVIGVAGSANAAYRITGMDIYGNGVVTASDPFAPPVGSHDYIHISLDLWPPFPGNPYAPIPTDATGSFYFVTIGGPWGFDVNITDVFNRAFCEACRAEVSLVNGELGSFFFDAGVDPVSYVAVSDSQFYGEVLRPDFSRASYRGTFTANRIVIHTDAPTSVPEPASWVLMLAGFLGAGQALRRMARRSRCSVALRLAA